MRAPLAIALLALAAHVEAQDCAEGRERSEGYCCWPGQTFSLESRRCEGAPRCPEAFAEHGEDCVARAITSAPPAASAVSVPTASASGEMQPSVPAGYARASAPTSDRHASLAHVTNDDAWPATHEGSSLHRAAHVRGHDEMLITFAVTMFDAGWVLGWIGAALDEATGACFASCQSWPLAFIPLGGGIAAVTANFGSSFRESAIGIPFAFLSALLQGAGLIAAAIAVENRTTEIGFPELSTGDVTISFVPAAPGALAGLSIEGLY